MSTALFQEARHLLADDKAAAEAEFNRLVIAAADGTATGEDVASFVAANPTYTVEQIEQAAGVIVAARELQAERVAAVAKLKSFDAKGAAKAVTAAETDLAKLDVEREQWLAKFIARRTAAEQALAAAREAADEPERLTHFLTRTAPAEKRERLASLPEMIRTTANRIAVLRSQTESYERIAAQRTLESGEFIRLERSGARFESGVVNADKSFAQRKLDAIRGEIAGAEYALQTFKEELESLPAELLVP